MIFHPPSSWPVATEHDVIVCGAGPAGIAAACGAGRMGLRTLIVERAGFAGGVATNCCCPYLMGFAAGGRQIVGGLADELVRDMDARGDARFVLPASHTPDTQPIGDRPLLDNIIISLEGFRLAANRLLDRYGVTRLYYASLIGAVTQGDHLAAIAVARELGVSTDDIRKGLAAFGGVKRRFTTTGVARGVRVIDDYGHHPVELRTTLAAARAAFPGRRLVLAFQPHRYTRTKFLRQEFGGAFTRADLLILTDIYAAGEEPILGISGETLKEEVERQTGQRVTYIPDRAGVTRYLAQIVEPGDMVITMGAGNIYQAGEELVEKLLAESRQEELGQRVP